MKVTQSIGQLRAALQDSNVRAWLRVIRFGETDAEDDDAYHALYGWNSKRKAPRFDDMRGHPKVAVLTSWGYTSAAGAYQAMAEVNGKVTIDTWGECYAWCRLNGHNLTMEPSDQDLFAVWCTARRGALPAILDGDIVSTIQLCSREWASLPGSPYGQPTRTLVQCMAIYRQFGGRDKADERATAETETAAPAQPPSTAAPVVIETKEPTPMLPAILAALLPALIEHAPSLIRVFGNGGEITERNAKAAEQVASIARSVTDQPTTEGAAAVLAAEPEKAAAFREQVHQSMGELLGLLMQAGQADAQERASALDRNLQLGKATNGVWLWLLGAVAFSVVLFSLAVVWQVLFGSKEFSEGVKMLLLGQVVLAGFGLVMAFLFGTNLQNRVSQAQERRGDQ